MHRQKVEPQWPPAEFTWVRTASIFLSTRDVSDIACEIERTTVPSLQSGRSLSTRARNRVPWSKNPWVTTSRAGWPLLIMLAMNLIQASSPASRSSATGMAKASPDPAR